VTSAARDVVITGLGMVSPAGVGTAENWRRVCAGESTAAVDPELVDSPVGFSCRVPGFDAAALLSRNEARRMDRCMQFAMVAAAEAIADAGLDPSSWDGARVAVVMGSVIGGVSSFEAEYRRLARDGSSAVSPLMYPMCLPNMLAGRLAMKFGAHGPNLVTMTACASGATAIGMARDLLALGRCDIAVAGGSEAMITPVCVAGYSRAGALSKRSNEPRRASRPFDSGRDGFVIAEGSGVLVLERAADARARRARSYARVAGYGASADAYHVTSPAPDGAGAERAIREALAQAGASPTQVEHVNAHATSTPIGDVVEAQLLRRVVGPQAAVTSTKGVTGHTCGASGALAAGYTALAVYHGVIPPTANLDNLDPSIDLDIVAKSARHQPIELTLCDSFGFGGQNAVLAIAR
jgi:3-oxoacyl-[acyl-carrier-protein] synthase II